MDFLTFRPIYQERVWGGRYLESKLDRALPEGGRIGESWELVDRREAQSIAARGKWLGKELRSILECAPEELMGPGYLGRHRFPLLVKSLDCGERSSLQVHPPAEVAAALGGEPKTELWYVRDAADEVVVSVGFRSEVSNGQFRKGLANGTVENLVHQVGLGQGDAMVVPSGRIHSCGAGCLLLEIQENSDTTFRVYDWGRVGLDGRPRTLHLEEALQCIDYSDVAPMPVRHSTQPAVLADLEEFRVTRHRLEGGGNGLEIASDQQPRLLHLVAGRLRETITGGDLWSGDNALLPFGGSYRFEAVGRGATVLLTENFV